MSKSTFIICAVNMVASAVALFLIFRSPAKPTIQVPPQNIAAVAPAEATAAPEEIWARFEQAADMQTAINALAKLPAETATMDKTADYVRVNNPAKSETVDFATVARVSACVRFLGTHGQWNSPHLLLLQSIAKDRQSCVIVRDLALRAVIDTAMRKHAVKEAGDADAAWRVQLADFLVNTEFGSETSIAGLALQAAVFIQNQGVTSVENKVLADRVRTVLNNHATAQEATLIAALEVSASLREADLADAVRVIVKASRSNAVLQMAVSALGKIGTSEDQPWLVAQIPNASAPLYFTTEAAWLGLRSAAVNEKAE